MPSPFPGMDPYLEDPEIFPDLHDRLIYLVSEFLQPSLPAPYFAVIGRRAWVEISERFIGPDVHVLRPRRRARALKTATGVAQVARPRAQPVIVKVPHDERREPFVEIYTRAGGQKRLVTCIEVLGLANKTPGEQGRALYQRKQREILESKVHLVEIDLLRGGEHSTAVPQQRMLAAAGTLDYHVCIHRYDNLEDYIVYPILLEDRLPEIAIPLLAAAGDVLLDLQAVFDRCYDAGPYRREVDYRRDEPVPSLTTKQRAWARARITVGG